MNYFILDSGCPNSCDSFGDARSWEQGLHGRHSGSHVAVPHRKISPVRRALSGALRTTTRWSARIRTGLQASHAAVRVDVEQSFVSSILRRRCLPQFGCVRKGVELRKAPTFLKGKHTFLPKVSQSGQTLLFSCSYSKNKWTSKLGQLLRSSKKFWACWTETVTRNTSSV